MVDGQYVQLNATENSSSLAIALMAKAKISAFDNAPSSLLQL